MESEAKLQMEIVRWFNNNYPELRGLLCYNLNNSEGSWRGKKNKFLGVIAGRSDLVLYHSGSAYMIELKNAKGTQRPAQVKWEKLVKSQGFEYVVLRTLGEFVLYVKGLIGY